MNSYERTRRICKVIVLVLGILSINNIILTIRNYSYAYFEKNVKTGVKLKITTLDEMPVKSEPLIDKLKEKLTSSNSITDTDGTIYLSGTNDTINFNYVWYSGKLWRITDINPDETIKLVTQDVITAIYWGEDTPVTYKDSWIYQWLNEDFLSTLYNYEDVIVQDFNWNATMDGKAVPVKPETFEYPTIVEGNIGLLNAYEYYQSYKNTNYDAGYLNIGDGWWLITPYTNKEVWAVSYDGELSKKSSSSYAYGVRPSINLKSNIKIVEGGDGSKKSPFIINDDKKSGKTGEFINTRISGEYVEVDNKKYRIVGIDKDIEGNSITKLTSVDYVRDGVTILTKYFGMNYNSNYADSLTVGSNNFWGYYLNKTWLTSELQKYITEGTYYLGKVFNASYKNSMCLTSNTTESTSSCAKTTSTWQGLVGLPRVGEMFSAQLADKQNGSSSSSIWLITPTSSTNILGVSSSGNLYDSLASSGKVAGARPTIFLKPEVIITSGNGMTPETAYIIGFKKNDY